MLARIFSALCRLPGLKKRLWRAWYQYLAGSQRAPDWCFMNYGYASPGAKTLKLVERDELDRHSIQLYDHVAKAIDLTGRSVLEVGSGRGGGSSYVKRYLRPSRMVGVDLSSKAVDFCRAAHRIEGLEFRVADAENLPFDGGSFDAVINVESSHCYPFFEKFLAEVHRVLRPGGYFLYADFRDRQNLQQWRYALRGSGMALLHETDITANVVAALDADNERKLDLINRLIPRILRPSFLKFAAIRGSVVFEGFRSGSLVYMSFLLRKESE
jgi:SAM-dependent methyltransferase